MTAKPVVGSGRGRIGGVAPGPVVVVREETMGVHREIAVGIRDPQDVTGALAFAFEEAALRRADLVAVHTWYWLPHVRGRAGELRPAAPERISAEASRQLAAALDGWRDKYPDVRVRQDVRAGLSGAQSARTGQPARHGPEHANQSAELPSRPRDSRHANAAG